MPDFLENELYHHGIKGQRWGVRRYQNEDGSLTPAGRRHWGVGPPEKGGSETMRTGRSSSSESKKSKVRIAKSDEKNTGVSGTRKSPSADSEKKSTTTDKSEKAKTVTNDVKKALDKDTLKKALMIGGGVAIAGLAAYGAYKYVGNKECRKILDQSKFSSVGVSDIVSNLNSTKAFEFDVSSYQDTLASAIAGKQSSWETSDTVGDHLASWVNIPIYSGGKNSLETQYPETKDVLAEISRELSDQAYLSDHPEFRIPIDTIYAKYGERDELGRELVTPIAGTTRADLAAARDKARTYIALGKDTVYDLFKNPENMEYRKAQLRLLKARNQGKMNLV